MQIEKESENKKLHLDGEEEYGAPKGPQPQRTTTGSVETHEEGGFKLYIKRGEDNRIE